MNAPNIVVSRHVGATPALVFAMISDLPRMGEWSPECTGGTWSGGASGPAVGARFKGTNTHGKKRWSTSVTVAVCDAPTSFAFDVSAVGMAIARWQYDIAADGDGCAVTESWIDKRNRVAKLFGGPASGVKERDGHNRVGMEKTLEKLAAAAEASSIS